MSLPPDLPADYGTGDTFTAQDEDTVEVDINDLIAQVGTNTAAITGLTTGNIDGGNASSIYSGLVLDGGNASA
jgi:hypothetical protein